MFTNLKQMFQAFSDENVCREFIAKKRWADGIPICPFCGHNKSYKIEEGKRLKCAKSTCYKKYSVTIGTVFESSNIPLTTWLPAIYLITAHKKGISSCQLARDLGITQKSAWFMLHRIRESLRKKGSVILSGIVECDETYVGGKYGNMHSNKRKEILKDTSAAHGLANKTTVLGIVERGGDLIAKVVPNQVHLANTVAETVQKESTLMTDSTNAYSKIIHSYNHHAVNHSIEEYVRGFAHTNTIEGAFSHFKRMIYGIYHQISAKHTQRYCDEFAYRFNSRKIKDADRFENALSTLDGRLSYKSLIKSSIPKEIVYTPTLEDRGYGVLQLKDGEIIGQFRTLKEAARKTGISRNGIRKTCKGLQKQAGEFLWIYA